MQITYRSFRRHLRFYIDKITKNHVTLFVTDGNGEDVILLSKSDYEGMQETFYLLKSPNNAARLLSAIESYNQSQLR